MSGTGTPPPAGTPPDSPGSSPGPGWDPPPLRARAARVKGRLRAKFRRGVKGFSVRCADLKANGEEQRGVRRRSEGTVIFFSFLQPES